MALDLSGAVRAAQEQDKAQEMFMRALNAALRSPHTIHRYSTHLAEVVDGGPYKVLMLGLPNGERLEIELGKAAAADVARALAAEPPVEEAA